MFGTAAKWRSSESTLAQASVLTLAANRHQSSVSGLARPSPMLSAMKAALVTGGSAGIGLAIARMLLEEGFGLTIAASRAESLAAAVAVLGLVHTVRADVSSEEDCARIVSAHREQFGRLDLLVNSAGVLVSGGIEDVPTDAWDRMHAVNARAIYVLAGLTLPLLRESRGLVVNVASLGGKHGIAGLAAYAASKAAVISLTQVLQRRGQG